MKVLLKRDFFGPDGRRYRKSISRFDVREINVDRKFIPKDAEVLDEPQKPLPVVEPKRPGKMPTEDDEQVLDENDGRFVSVEEASAKQMQELQSEADKALEEAAARRRAALEAEQKTPRRRR